jgi:hypothetical protein
VPKFVPLLPGLSPVVVRQGRKTVEYQRRVVEGL